MNTDVTISNDAKSSRDGCGHASLGAGFHSQSSPVSDIRPEAFAAHAGQVLDGRAELSGRTVVTDAPVADGRRVGLAFAAMVLGNATCLLLGAAWLSTLVGFEKALMVGVVPFLAGAVVKSALGAATLRALARG